MKFLQGLVIFVFLVSCNSEQSKRCDNFKQLSQQAYCAELIVRSCQFFERCDMVDRTSCMYSGMNLCAGFDQITPNEVNDYFDSCLPAIDEMTCENKKLPEECTSLFEDEEENGNL